MVSWFCVSPTFEEGWIKNLVDHETFSTAYYEGLFVDVIHS